MRPAGSTGPNATAYDHRCSHCVKRRDIQVEELRLGAKEGCPVYSLFLACFDWAVPALLEEEYVKDITLWLKPGVRSAMTLDEKDVLGDTILELFQLPDAICEDELTSRLATAMLLPGSSSSASTLSTIRSWLSACCATHAECQSIAAPLPDGIRFLAISDEILLLEPGAHLKAYVCPSHCWGSGKDIVKTLRDDYQKHCEAGIAVATLPKSFQDAVQICRNLGVKYLWIDSLCIIQDSEEDWRFQAALMADIYEGADFTIAAAHAGDPTQGCFNDTSSACVGQALPGYPGAYVRLQPEVWASRQWPLLGRGWVFQELFLSTRVVYFGVEEVVWQCRHENRRESQNDYSWGMVEGIDRVERLTDTRQEALDKHWRDVVRRYSRLQLSYEIDRLPAMAAMAERVERLRPDDRYMAGIWESCLLEQLVWSSTPLSTQSLYDHQEDAIRHRLRTGPHTPYGIPTWSWASTLGAVDMGPSKRAAYARVLAIDYQIEGPTVSGRIRRAALTLQAPLISLRHAIDEHTVDFDMHRALWDTESHLASDLVVRNYIWDGFGRGSRSESVPDCFALFLTGNQSRKAVVVSRVEGDTGACCSYIRLGTARVDSLGWYMANVFEPPIEDMSAEDAQRQPLALQEYNARFLEMLEGAVQTVTLV